MAKSIPTKGRDAFSFMLLTDTHTHLYLAEFDEDREAVFLRAREKGVTRFFLPNIDAGSIESVLKLTHLHPSCFPMLGLHPCSVKEDYRAQLESLQLWLVKEHFYAIGEIGIDLYWDKTFLKEQQEAFRIQIGWAKKMLLPVVIHSRESFNEIIEILQDEKGPDLKGVFHCFTGNAGQAKSVTDLGFYLGIGGVVTYKNAGLDRVLPHIDPAHIVLETDSPYLTPVPYRGKRNESAYLYEVADKVAAIYGRSVEDIAALTTENSIKLFGI